MCLTNAAVLLLHAGFRTVIVNVAKIALLQTVHFNIQFLPSLKLQSDRTFVTQMCALFYNKWTRIILTEEDTVVSHT